MTMVFGVTAEGFQNQAHRLETSSFILASQMLSTSANEQQRANVADNMQIPIHNGCKCVVETAAHETVPVLHRDAPAIDFYPAQSRATQRSDVWPAKKVWPPSVTLDSPTELLMERKSTSRQVDVCASGCYRHVTYMPRRLPEFFKHWRTWH